MKPRPDLASDPAGVPPGGRRPMLIGMATSLALSIAVLAPALLFRWVFVPWDHYVHLRWSGQFAAALRDGWLTPRWAFAANSGLGDPTFLFYQPLLYYASSLLVSLGSPPEIALIRAGWLPFVLAGCVVAVAVARVAGTRAVLLAVVLVVTSPALYLLYSQLAAFPSAFSAPFYLLFVLESVRDKPSPTKGAIWLALTCLAHLLSGLMVLVTTAVARAILFPPAKASKDRLSGHVAYLASVALGLGLAGFYLVPALTLQHLINPDAWSNFAEVDWHRAFAFPTFTYLRYGWAWFSLQVLVPLLALAMIAAVFAAGRGTANRDARDARRLLLARRLATVALVAIVFSTELAYPAYAWLPPLQRLQHPYRFVVLGQVIGCVAFALVAFDACGTRRRLRDLAAAAIVVASVAFTLRLELVVYRQGQRAPSYASVIERAPGQREYRPVTRGEHWEAYNAAGGFAAECERLQLVCHVSADALSTTFRIAAPVATRVRLPRFAFPAWQPSLDDATIASTIDPPTGLITIDVPAGEHVVRFRWVALPAEVVGRWMSGFAALSLLLRGLRRAKPSRTPPTASVRSSDKSISSASSSGPG